ncbi:MAG: restriction endonuclease [Anaerolineales bacterium]|nr:restriction endonuclease [Anaerolineales bacterium]
MPEITVQRTSELIRKLFEILMSKPEGMRAKEALDALQNAVQLTEYEKGQFASGQGIRFVRIVRFATIDFVKAGWLLKEKGWWLVTEDGKKAFQQYKEAEQFYREAKKLYREWKRSHTDASDVEVEEDVDDKRATITFEEAEEQAWGEIEEYLRNMNPYDFQKVVASLLKAMGYHVTWIAPPGKDGGVDVIAWNDPLGTKPPRIKVQVKREQNAVNVSILRSFLALLGDSDVGIFVCTGGFTKDAREEARTQQSRQVTLVDLERLFELWVQHRANLDEEARDLFPLKPIYFLSPE